MFFSLGLSAQAIDGSGNHHPHDPSDLLRCMRYCDERGIDTDCLRSRMAGRSATWDRLLPEWDALVALLREEMNTRTDGLAPRTYIEMGRVIYEGTACLDCAATGRGAACIKCKGTGRRSGGKCRADRCYRGADFCPACHGKGYTTERKAS